MVVARQDYLYSFKLKPLNKNEQTLDSGVRSSSRQLLIFFRRIVSPEEF